MNQRTVFWLLTAMVVTVIISLLFITSTAMMDEVCAEALGHGATYLHNQSLTDSQLDCIAPNGTVIRDVNPPPMNVTSST